MSPEFSDKWQICDILLVTFGNILLLKKCYTRTLVRWKVQHSYLFFSQILGKQIGHNQTMLVQSRRQKWHGASCPTSNGILVLRDSFEFSDWQPAVAMVEACHREPVWGMKIVIFASRFLAPFTHSHGVWINACVSGRLLSGFIFSS